MTTAVLSLPVAAARRRGSLGRPERRERANALAVQPANARVPRREDRLLALFGWARRRRQGRWTLAVSSGG